MAKAETAQAEKAEISQYAINSLEFTQEELSQGTIGDC